MPKPTAPKQVNGTDQVDEFMRQLNHPLKAEIEAVRKIILKTDSRMMERIKWNAPSFFYIGDFAAFHLRQTDFVHLIVVYPKDTVIKDSTGLLEADHKDRREAKFYSMADIKSKKAALETVVKDWLCIVEK